MAGMTLTEDFYRSANGDRWQLVRDPGSGRLFVRHEPNLASGGRVTDTDIQAFLDQTGSSPEHLALRAVLDRQGVTEPAGAEAIGDGAAATPSAGSAEAELIDDLVAANRILADQSVLDGFGHVSARHDKDPNRFLLARSMAPALVTTGDIMEFDLDGNAIDGRGRTAYLERFIHSEIYKAHPEVGAVVHSHSPAVIPFGVVSVALRPIFHLGGFLGGGVPVFEIREAGGPATDMLIRNPALGAALAKTLGRAPVALMRGHGNVVVAGSIREAVFRAIYTEVNARLESEALRLGEGQVAFLNEEEAKAAAEPNSAQIGRPWELWKAKALARSG
jgi:HCOMODA/2-hydroxy-3-carboxy-muconic semialdehyde decarboxylase